MKTVIFNQWFGDQFPEWMPQFVERIEANPGVDFVCFTNLDEDLGSDRVKLVNTTPEEFDERIENLTGIKSNKSYDERGVASCDQRPFIPSLYPELMEGYDFWGWVDLDVVIGNVSSFLSNDFDVFTGTRKSLHKSIYCGLAFFRNCELLNSLWKDERFLSTVNKGFCGAVSNNWSPLVFEKADEGKLKIWHKPIEINRAGSNVENVRLENNKLFLKDEEMLFFHFRPDPKVWPF